MRYVTAIELHNWGPFRGTHNLELGPTVYAVTAQHELDVDRSNWIGKTWFLSAMLFALTGQKPESCRAEDDWITHDEDEGYVKLTADDGTLITRARKRGRSTQLTVALAGGKPQRQGPAQDSLYRAMGLDAGDLMATSFVRQKQIARLILSDPAERTKIVNGWVELEPLQLAEEWLRARLNKLLAEQRGLSAGDPPEGDLAELRAKLVEAEAGVEEIRTERDELAGNVAELAAHQNHEQRADEFSETQRVGKMLKAEIEKAEPVDIEGLDAELVEATAAKEAARDREYELRGLVHGEWDGKCPLTCEDCPEEASVRAQGASMQVELGEAEIVLDEADARQQAARKALDDARNAQAQLAMKEQRLVQLRAKAEELIESVDYIDEHGPAPTADEHRAQLAELDTELEQWRASVAQLTRAIEAHEAHAKELAKVDKRLQALEHDIRLHQEAVAVVGRLGAQREVAEGALGKIQRKANELLQQSGIPLQVAVRWAREGRGLAKHCEACGSAFPASQKVKVCDICGASRGPHLVEKLDIQPSDRSGAADDIAGLAFQLAASVWLRGKRSASWSSTCIDEPFGALDTANSRALSTHLHALIRGNYAFDQGFLVAHDAAVMESLPAQVKIYGGAEGAAIEVIH